MALTEDLLPGNNTPGPYNFTFKWLESSDIYVSVDGVDQTETTDYTLQGLNFTTKEGGQVLFTTSIPSTSSIRIYRNTDDTATKATFYPGSAIRSQDLNENFTQNLYVTQEANRNATESLTTINTANQNATAAVVAANTAIATANQASTDAATAVSTANTASTTASTAVTTANTAASDAANAVTTANSALSAVSNVLNYTTINNVASIPSSPTNGDAIRVVDSTGIESFTPLSGLPVGFVGDAGLTVELVYQSPNWLWARYYPVDPENRYGAKADLTQAQSDIIGLDSSKLDVTTAASTYLTQANAASTYLTQANATSTYLTQSAASSTYLSQASATSTYLTQANAASTYQAQHTNTITAVNKTLINNERCTVTAAGVTVTLPASPTQGDEVTIIVGGAFTNTVVGRNGSNIMSLSQDLTIDRENVSITLLYVDATRGWRII